VSAPCPSRAEVEELFYREAALLDEWRLDEWLALLTDDACYYVPPNDKPDADHRSALFTIADNTARLKERVRRIKDRNCHAEHPHSRTRRMIGNVRVIEAADGECEARANFIIHRFRRGEDVRVFVGEYRYRLRREGTELKIAERRAILDAEELGSLGAVSFIL
jgi:p-cumate 2,3-dioxygenase subunit beta